MNNFKTLINSNQPTLVDFYATWCGPCHTMAPILEQTAEILKEKAKIIKIDVDKNPSVAKAYGIKSIPTLILFKNGQIKWRKSGVVSSQVIVQEVTKIY